MPYISSFEQIAMKKGKALGKALGKASGRAEGLKDGLVLALKAKFGEAGEQLAAEVSRISDLETLRRLTASVATAASLEDVIRAWSD